MRDAGTVRAEFIQKHLQQAILLLAAHEQDRKAEAFRIWAAFAQYIDWCRSYLREADRAEFDRQLGLLSKEFSEFGPEHALSSHA